VVLGAALTGCGSSSMKSAGGSTSTTIEDVPALLMNVPQPVVDVAYLLQDELTKLGYNVGQIDDGFTDRVTQALKEFQTSKGLPADGAMDQATAVALRKASGREQPTIVRAIQSVLTELGLYTDIIDGDYGPETIAAVKKLQSESGLPQTGKVDAATLVASVDLWRKKKLPAPPQPPIPPLSQVLNVGDSGPQVMALQKRLTELGYRTGDSDGHFGVATNSAVTAFEKHEGLPRDGVVGPQVQDHLKNPTGAGPKSMTPTPHVEVDLDRQIAFIVLSSAVTILDVSTGSGQTYVTPGTTNPQVAYTPVGTFAVYRRVGELVRAPLGTLYKPLYFKEGWAIHGEPIVPPYPGSHGCVRTHDWDQDWLFPQIPLNTPVNVYGNNPAGNNGPANGGAGY
jgi:peptidoglycan hydrolase-like protein with peptidoglycan-binding domain